MKISQLVPEVSLRVVFTLRYRKFVPREPGCYVLTTLDGDVLYVGGMPITAWSKLDDLNARFNRGVYAEQAVFLEGSDGHTGWSNRALLRRAGVTRDFLAHLSLSERAYYGVDANGDPNGFGVDAGLEKVQAAIPQRSKEQLLQGGRAAVRYLNSLGITAWVDADPKPPFLETYKSLSQKGELSAHVAAFPVVNPRNDPAKELEIVNQARAEYAGLPGLASEAPPMTWAETRQLLEQGSRAAMRIRPSPVLR